MNTPFDLTGKRALVTGSSRGIGKAIAFALGRAGAEVFFHASKPAPRLDETLAQAKAEGINAFSVTADLSGAEAAGEIRKITGDLDILVLNASSQIYMTVEQFDETEFLREVQTNVGSSYLLIRQFVDSMVKRQWGRVLAIGSVNQWKQAPRLTVYAATKAAQENMIMSCARSYSQFGITFNNLAPGVITTDRNIKACSDPETVKMLMAQIPAKRFGKPEDCAGLALLLCSDAGSYITGANIPVTGGMHL